MKILLNAGRGDAFVLMSHKDWSEVSEVYWASNAESFTRPLLQLVHPHLVQHHLASPAAYGKKAFWYFNDVPGVHGIDGLQDWTVDTIWPHLRSGDYQVNPLLTMEPEQEIDHHGCICICPTSGNEASGRNFDDADWRNVIDQLERDDKKSIVLGIVGEVPKHKRLINLMNCCTMSQCIEILKKSDGYIGIDSCLAVLACQIFPNDKLQIKSVNCYYNMHKRLFAAPKTTFEYISDRIRSADDPIPQPEDDRSDGNMSLAVQRMLGHI